MTRNGQLLREVRVALGLSLNDAADLAGLRNTILGGMERCEVPVSDADALLFIREMLAPYREAHHVIARRNRALLVDAVKARGR